MVIILHKGGWSASNDASIEQVRTPIFKDGKTTAVKKTEYCKIKGLFTVSGVCEGEVELAIKDDQSGEVVGFRGIVDDRGVRITDSGVSTEWLKKI